MESDKNKTKDELIQELNALRSQFNERTACFEQECLERGRTEEELRLAQVIIDNSPVVLFRRMAGDKPKLVYVSDNVRQMGYTAREFLEDKIHFKDIVHPDDLERIGENLGGFVNPYLGPFPRFLGNPKHIHGKTFRLSAGYGLLKSKRHG